MATHSSIHAWEIPWIEEPMVHRFTESWTQLKKLSTNICNMPYILLIYYFIINKLEYVS